MTNFTLVSEHFATYTLLTLEQTGPYNPEDPPVFFTRFKSLLDEADVPIYFIAKNGEASTTLTIQDVGKLIKLYLSKADSPFRHPNLAGYVSIGARSVLAMFTELALERLLAKHVRMATANDVREAQTIIADWVNG